jgi:hypothetical protein
MSAAGLGMKNATIIAKKMETSSSSAERNNTKIVGFSLAVTAPDAFEATNR